VDRQLHDLGYRYLFEDPLYVRQLLETFVKEPWLAELDLGALRPLGDDFVDQRLLRRQADA
jgi:hypothetical protein